MRLSALLAAASALVFGLTMSTTNAAEPNLEQLERVCPTSGTEIILDFDRGPQDRPLTNLPLEYYGMFCRGNGTVYKLRDLPEVSFKSRADLEKLIEKVKNYNQWKLDVAFQNMERFLSQIENNKK